MADSISVIYRGVAIEDLLQSLALAQTTGPVLNVGTAVPITPFLVAASDAAALTAGTSTGDVYINTATVPYRLRSAASAYANWNPSLSTGVMTFASLSFANSTYVIDGSNAFIALQFSVTFGGTAQPFFYVQGLLNSLIGIGFSPISGVFLTGSISPTVMVAFVQNGEIYVQHQTANFTLGTAYTFFLSGAYRVS